MVRARQQAPTFRAGVDLVAVDVQVVAGNGLPIAGLGPEKFQVSINGRRRRVVSAQLVRHDTTSSIASSWAVDAAPAPAVTAAVAPALSPDGRVYVIAIDLHSFRPGATGLVTTAARQFIEKLQPMDRVGLVAFPSGLEVDPTTDHEAVVRGLDTVVGLSDPPVSFANRFGLNPSNIVDITVATQREAYVDINGAPPESGIRRVVDEVCAYDQDPEFCRRWVLSDAQALAAYEEGLAVQRLGAVRALLGALAGAPGRKTVVLVSAGLPGTDVPGGRPDIGELGMLVGQEAARANTTIYALHVDARRMEQASGAAAGRPRPSDNQSRNSAILGRPLDQIASLSGGTRFTVVQGGGEAAFERIRLETSSLYILGVEPDESDRTGEPRQLSVRVDTGQRGTTVRARSWVVVPKPGSVAVSARTDVRAPAPPAVAAPAAPAVAPIAAAAPSGSAVAPEPPVVTRTVVDDLFDKYSSGDRSVLFRELRAAADFERVRPDLVSTLSRWRTEWSPAHASFAMDVAVTAYARSWPNPQMFLMAARRLVLGRPDAPGARPDDDRVELRFHRAAVALLSATEGPHAVESYLTSIQDRVALGVSPRKSAMLKDEHLAMALAVVRERQTSLPLLSVVSRRDDPATWTVAKNDGRTRRALEEVAELLQLAEAFDETRIEASVRRAFVLHRLGSHQDALALLAATSPIDPTVDCWKVLIQGRALAALGSPREAIAAFERAAALAPDAQTAAVALTNLFLKLGDRAEAMTWARRARTTTEAGSDPWPLYWTGSSRFLGQWLAELRAQ